MDYKSRGLNLSSQDTVLFKQRIIDKWKPLSDVWALKFGDEILGSVTIFGSLYVTHIFRKELKIRPFATVTCYLPVVGLSAVAITAFHTTVITKNILNRDACPTCVLAKAGFGHVMSLGYSLIAAPLVCFYVADRLLTYPVPPLFRAPRETFLLFHKIVRKYKKPLSFVGALYMITACFITSQKYKNLEILDLKTTRE